MSEEESSPDAILEEATGEPQVKLLNREPQGGAVQIYTNSIDVSWTSYDVQLRLCHNHRLPSEPPTNLREHRAIVSMAWPEAKALAVVLADILQKFEAKNGKIGEVEIP